MSFKNIEKTIEIYNPSDQNLPNPYVHKQNIWPNAKTSKIRNVRATTEIQIIFQIWPKHYVQTHFGAKIDRSVTYKRILANKWSEKLHTKGFGRTNGAKHFVQKHFGGIVTANPYVHKQT